MDAIKKVRVKKQNIQTSSKFKSPIELKTALDIAKENLLSVLQENAWEQIIVGFSGGKDSTATLQLLLDTCITNDIDVPIKVLSSNTLIENPLIEKQLLLIQNQIKEINEKSPINIEHLILTPKLEDSFFVNTIGKGYATPLSTMGRWCTRALKVDPMEKYYKNLKVKTLVLSGVREDESILRKKNIKNYFNEELKKDSEYIFKYAPIRNFQLNDVWDYIMDIFRKEYYYLNNNSLWELYRDGSSQDVCPSSLDISISNAKSKCGKSRYGCYMCPLVSRDKALEANVENGHEELKGYLELREWYMKRCYDPKYRSRFNRRGNVLLKEIAVSESGNFDFKMLYTICKGNINLKTDYLSRKIIIVEQVRNVKSLITKLEKNGRFENDDILIIKNIEKEGIKYYRPTTAMLSYKFRKEFYDKVIEIEKSYGISILQEGEKKIIESMLNKN